MNRVVLLLTVMLGAALWNGAAAQGIKNVRINEVLVENVTGYEDDYGNRSSWIELFNAGYEAVSIAQCWLEVERTDGSRERYQIPKDPATLMHSQTYLVFFCDGSHSKGTFYTNFTLEKVTEVSGANRLSPSRSPLTYSSYIPWAVA